MIIAIANSIGSGVAKASRGPDLITNGNFSEIGSELFTDSGFTNGVDDWTTTLWQGQAGGVGAQALLSPATTDTYIYQNVLTSDKYYKTEWDLNAVLPSYFTTHIAKSNSADYFDVTTADDSNIFLATGTYLGFRAKYVAGYSVVYLNSFSVKELNPNLSSQWTLPSGWSASDRLIGSSTTGEATQTISSLETGGTTYEVSFEILTVTSGSVRWRVSKSNGTSVVSGATRSTTGVFTEQFTNYTSSRNLFKIDGVSSFSGTIGNIRIRKVLD
jgi:hypothetical protein